MLEFYDQRRRAFREAQPNAAHRALVDLERADDVRIVTQNVDDLHERAGSTKVLHLQGEIMLARGTRDPRLVRRLGERDNERGDRCEFGSQLRPHIVWFGELWAEDIGAETGLADALECGRRARACRDVRRSEVSGADLRFAPGGRRRAEPQRCS